jgi:AcrR family transcriptional regulator
MRRADAGEERHAATPADAFRAAARMFIKAPRLDMGRLAEELKISKATLYRWTGSREQLIAEVLAYLSQNAFDEALSRTERLRGTERVLAALRLYIEAIVSFAPLRRFIQNETRLALRLLTTREGLPQGGAVRMVADLLTFEHEEHGMDLRAPADTLAYATIRMIEGFIYTDPVVHIDPDVDAAVTNIGLLL